MPRSTEERKGFELIASACSNLDHHHRLRSANGFPTKRWQKRREQIADDIAEAEKDGASDELPALREALRRADAAVKGFGLLGRAHQGGKRDAAREWLYSRRWRCGRAWVDDRLCRDGGSVLREPAAQ